MFRYYDLLSDLSSEEITVLKAKMEKGHIHPKEVKKQLARELTTRFHSPEAAVCAEKNFEKVFQKKGLPDEIPEVAITASGSVWLPQLLVDTALVKSTSDGRRMIKQNAVSVNGKKVGDENTAVDSVGEVLLKVGKRRFCKVIFS